MNLCIKKLLFISYCLVGSVTASFDESCPLLPEKTNINSIQEDFV